MIQDLTPLSCLFYNNGYLMWHSLFVCRFYLTPDICFQLHKLQIINPAVSLNNNLLSSTGWKWGKWTYRASRSCSKSITFTCSLPWKIEIATTGKGQMCDEPVNGFKSLHCTHAFLKSQILIRLFALQTSALCMGLSEVLLRAKMSCRSRGKLKESIKKKEKRLLSALWPVMDSKIHIKLRIHYRPD